MWNARLDEAQAGIKIARRNNNNFRYADDTPLMAASEEELKSLLMRVREWKSWLKTQHSENEDQGTGSHHFMSNRKTVRDFIFLGSKITVDGDCSHEIKTFALWKEIYDKPRHCIKKQRHHFADKGSSGQSYGFSSSHVWMWELDHKESWAQKNRCFWNVVLAKTLGSPLDCKEIQPVHPKENQSWIFIGRTDDKAKAPILWPPDGKSWSLGKTLMLGKMAERKRIKGWQMIRWLNGITDSMDMSQQAQGDSEGQGSLVCCSPQGCSKSSSSCCFLTCIKVSQETGKVVWYPHLFKNFPQFVVIHTAKGSHIVHLLLKPRLKDFEHHFTSRWNEHNCTVVRAFFGIAFLWHWNENWSFPVLWPLPSFPNLLAYWVQHLNSIII